MIIHPKDKSTDFLKVVYAGKEGFTVINSGTKEEVVKAIDTHDHIIMMGHGTPSGLLGVNQFKDKVEPKALPKVESKPVTTAYTASKPKGIKSYSSYQPRGGYAPSHGGYFDDYNDEYDGDFGFARGTTMSGSYVKEMTTGYVINESHADRLRDKELTTIWCNADQFIEWNKLGGFYTGMFISEVGEAKIIGLVDTEQWQVDESNYGFVRVVRENIEQPAEVLYKALKDEYGAMAKHNPVAKYNYRRLYLAGESNADAKVGPISVSAT